MATGSPISAPELKFLDGRAGQRRPRALAEAGHDVHHALNVKSVWIECA